GTGDVGSHRGSVVRDTGTAVRRRDPDGTPHATRPWEPLRHGFQGLSVATHPRECGTRSEWHRRLRGWGTRRYVLYVGIAIGRCGVYIFCGTARFAFANFEVTIAKCELQVRTLI